MRMPIADEGIKYGIIPIILGVFFWIIKFWILGSIFIAISLLIFLFFRYPDRTVVSDPKYAYAPADGRIVCVREEFEKEFLNAEAHRISIFMSVFNVHINYSPVNGDVEHVEYSRGRFINAGIIGTDETNENNFIGISTGVVKIGVRQVAGWIARRIVCDCKKGDKLIAGKRFGLIRFGSRVDVFLPKDYYNICVKIGDTIRAGRTIIGKKE